MSNMSIDIGVLGYGRDNKNCLASHAQKWSSFLKRLGGYGVKYFFLFICNSV